MQSIRSRITKAYITVSIVATVALLLPLYIATERYLYERFTGELKTEASAINALVRELSDLPLKRDDVFRSLRSMASAAKLRITLIAEDGKVLFESERADTMLEAIDNHGERPEVREARERGIGTDRRLSRTIGIQMIYVARLTDVRSSEVFPGLEIVRIGFSSADYDREVGEIRLMFLTVGVLAFALLFVVSRIISGRIAKPILEIGAIVADIKAGNLSRKLPVRSDDEIGRLAELINEMTDALTRDIEQLRKLERFRSEFLGNVSHELRTPIFSLKGYLETLSEGAVDDPSVNKQFLEKAYHHASRLDTLLTDLIEISRIESGDMKMSFRYFDVAAFLRVVRDDFIDDAEKKGQKLLVQARQEEMTAFGDKERLRQAVGSLVDNAIKYSSEGATITLDASDARDRVIVSVSDTGPGIAPEHLPRIFERFYRVDKNRSRDVGGTGLGLAIAKHIVEAHGTRLRVESMVGKGSRFFFDLKK